MKISKDASRKAAEKSFAEIQQWMQHQLLHPQFAGDYEAFVKSTSKLSAKEQDLAQSSALAIPMRTNRDQIHRPEIPLKQTRPRRNPGALHGPGCRTFGERFRFSLIGVAHTQ